jgi:hypothetical protein
MNKKNHFVDMYYNDLYGLNSTISQIKLKN